jgi:hypothetical protein
MTTKPTMSPAELAEKGADADLMRDLSPNVAEKALAAVIQEAYIRGVPNRSVDELVKAHG